MIVSLHPIAPPPAIAITAAGPVVQQVSAVENRPSGYRSMVTASRVPSGAKPAQNLGIDPVYNQATAGQHRAFPMLSSVKDRPHNAPVTHRHSDGRSNAPHGPNVPALRQGSAGVFNQQIKPAEPSMAPEGRDLDHIFSHQMETIASNMGSMPGAIAPYTAGPPAPNPMKPDLSGPRGKSATWHAKKPGGPQYTSSPNNSCISSPQFPHPANLPDVTRVVSAENRGPLVQVHQALQAGTAPFPVYSLEPLPSMSQQPPMMLPSLTLPQRGYPQRPPSFGQGKNSNTAAGNHYQGYHFGNVELPRLGNDSQGKVNTSGRTGSDQTLPQQPAMYAGNNQAQSRPQGHAASRRNPRKSFSDDARILPPQETAGQREISGEFGRSRTSSSASTYDPQVPGESNWQRGHHRQYGPYRGGQRRTSLSQHPPAARDGVPIEGGFSHMGYFGGGGGSGDFGHLVHQTIQEDHSEGTQHASFHGQAVKIVDGAAVEPLLPREPTRTGVGGLPISASSQAPSGPYSHGKDLIHYDPAMTQPKTHRPEATSGGFVPSFSSPPSKETLNPAVIQHNDSPWDPTRVDPLKVYISANGLPNVQEVLRLFEPYGTVVRFVGPFTRGQTAPDSFSSKTWFYIT